MTKREAIAADIAAQDVDAAAAEFKKRYVDPQFGIGDALKPRPPMEWVVDGFGADGHIVGVFGKPGSGKTYAMLDMAACIVSGTPWLGRETKRRPILWIDEDAGEETTLRRLGEVARGHDLDDTYPFRALSMSGVNITTSEGQNHLYRLLWSKRVDGHGPVCIIDTLADVCVGLKIVHPDDMVAPLQSLRRIADAARSMVVFIHHANKLGAYLGATTISGKADLLLGVEVKTETTIELKSEKARHVAPIRFAARQRRTIDIDGQGHTFTMEPIDMTSADRDSRIRDMRGAPKHVYEHLRENGTSSIVDMTTDLYEKRAVQKAVERLKDDRVVVMVSKGVYALAAEASS